MDFTDKPHLDGLTDSDFFDLQNPPFNVEDYTIYSVVSGSRAYGTNVAGSDTDVRGVMVPPLKYFTGLASIKQIENQSKDICYYSLRRFFELACKNNVHALEMLYMHPSNINFVSPIMQKILDNRALFLSRNIGFSFGGYGHQSVLQMDIKKNNNTGRVSLIDKYGYDTKMFMHAVRLYRMGAEALSTGTLTVKRPDASELLEIRNGKYSFEEAVQMEKRDVEVVDSDGSTVRTKRKVVITGGFIKGEADRFNDAFSNSRLPASPDISKIESLLMKAHSEIGWLNSLDHARSKPSISR